MPLKNLPVRLPLQIVVLWLSMCPFLNASGEFDHGIWDQLLKQHVVAIDQAYATRVDYSSLLADRARLLDYLNSLAAVSRGQFDGWTSNKQLAFLINAYNAWTVELILTEYPELESIKDLGFLFRSPWRKKFIPLFGNLLSLDEIEHEMIRGWDRYQEPRIHFAVNCAAIGCPALRAEAYQGDILERQLEENTREFLSDRSRNYLAGDRLWVSSIFDWYKVDFEQGWLGVNSVGEFLARYSDALDLNAETSRDLRNGRLRLRYSDYDWSLNGLR